MRSILIICALVALVAACPPGKDGKCKCKCKSGGSSSVNLPPICPPSWKIKKFDSQCATQAFQGKWYLQMSTPTYISGLKPLRTGLFSNGYPCVSNRVFFRDTTPGNKFDMNTDYYMIDSSFNMATQCVETTRTLFKGAYGSNSPYAIFNVGTPSYYETPMSELSPLCDDTLIRHKIDGDFVRDYTVAVIGADDCWKEYMVFTVINKYDNIFGGNDNNIIWLFTRDANPDFSIYNRAFNDIKDNGLSHRYLISIDHSIDLANIPTVTPDDIEGIVTTSVTSSSSSRTISTDGVDSTTITSSTSSTTVQTTTSTVDFTLRPDYTIPYKFSKYELSGDVQILQDLEFDVLKDALRGQYYITSATPSMYDDCDDARIGLLNTAGPYSSMQIIFDDSMSAWDVNAPTMMVLRGYNMMDGKVQYARQVVQPAYDASSPWRHSVFSIYSEPYYKTPRMTPFTVNGLISKKPTSLYDDHYMTCIAGYQKDKFLLLNIVNKYKNPLFTKDQPSQFYVLSRSRTLSADTIADINQELCRCGYNPRYLNTIDHTRTIDDVYTFDRTYFQLDGAPMLPGGPIDPRCPGYPAGLPRGLPSSCALPSIIPKKWNVKTFDSQYATQAFQGPWYVQMATPSYINNGVSPLKTGLFSNCYPCAKNRVIFRDTTPGTTFDMNTDFYMIDSAFNIATQRIETTRTLFKGAYGSTSPYAIFNVGTPKYYKNPITDRHPLLDDALIRHKIEGDYLRDYTLAVIGADDSWKEYMVFAVVNQYDNIYCGNDNRMIWVLTRDSNPNYNVVKKAYTDILNSGLSPKYLMSIDQSPDLTTISTVTTDDIDGVITTSVTKSSSSQSISTDGCDSTISTSTSTTTVETTTSTVEFMPRLDYSIPYEYGVYDSFGDVKILKNLQADMIRDALRGQYYVNSATPCMFDDADDARIGLLNTAFPATSLQLMFDDSITTPWDVNSRVMMMDRGYNIMTNKMQQTRNIVQSTFDGSVPWGAFTFYSEGYYKNPLKEISPLTLDGMICQRPADLYREQYYAGIVGYQKDKFLMINIVNKFQNKFYSENQPNGLLYVMTRDRILSADTINDINQELCRCGYNPRYLSNIDQTRLIEDAYSFDSSYFQYDYSTSSSSSSVTVESSGISVDGTTVTTSSSSYSMTTESSSGIDVEIC